MTENKDQKTYITVSYGSPVFKNRTNTITRQVSDVHKIVDELDELQKQLVEVHNTVNNIELHCSNCGACELFRKCFRIKAKVNVDKANVI